MVPQDFSRIKDTTYREKLVQLPEIIEGWVREHRSVDDLDILDFGCGEGTTALGFAMRPSGHRVVGVDIMPDAEQCAPLAQKYLGLAELPSNLSLHRVAPGTLHDPVYRYDLIYSWSVFEHVSRDLLPATVDLLRAALRPRGLLFVQIAPLYYSSEGSHFFADVPERWGHLLRQTDDYRDKLHAAKGADFGQAMSVLDTLNRLTAPELLEMLRAGGFEIIRDYTTREDYTIPPSLLHAYQEEALRTNQVVVLAKPNH